MGTLVLAGTGVKVGIAVGVDGVGVFVGVGTNLNSTLDGASRNVIGVGDGVSEKTWSKALEKGVPTACGSVPNPVLTVATGDGVDVGVAVSGTDVAVEVGKGVTFTGPAQAATPIRKGTITKNKCFIQTSQHRI